MRALLALAVVIGLASVAHAQGVDRRYAEEPTGGVDIPATPLAGEHDARAVTYNPGGLALLRGAELALALNVDDENVATSAGTGFGIYAAGGVGGKVLPRYGFGIGLEWLRPPRSQLEPDPGEPFRFTASLAQGLGKNAGFGVSWHHFHDDGVLSGVDTFDLGLSLRAGNQLALGAALRDIATGPIDKLPVQRRYELEAVFRPLSTDRLEIALGGRIGETRGDLDGWGRLSWRIGRGAWVTGSFESRDLHAFVDSGTGVTEQDGRDVRATFGLEISLGHLGVTALATGLRDDTDSRHFLGGAIVVRASSVGPPSVAGEKDHIERIELEGELGVRQLTAIVARMRAIAKDPHVVALVISFDDPSGGWASFQELHDEVLRIRKAGKKVYAYMMSGTGRDYLVASAADKIYVDPAGGLRIVGMAGTSMYFKGTFDMLGVTPQFEKIGEYKSAPEEFTETGPTPAAARMHEEMFDSMWTQWLEQVAAGRRLSVDELKKLVDNGPYTSGELASDKKLVDGVGPPEKISELVLTDLGRAYPVGAPEQTRPDRWKRPGIAVIYVDGDITDGKSRSVPLLGEKTAGGETLVAAVAAARADPDVGAIVLRIDSPGGSALASELIAREVFATRGVKPIICSMNDLAASGGYFVAAGCDVIFAEPMTITGSIGIFFGKFDVSGLLKKLGVTMDTYKRGARSDVETMYRPYTDEERSVLLEKLRYSYTRFVGSVAEGRKLSKDDVDAVGRGHVWTGAQAAPIKLVDRFGGIGDALDEAKKRMGISADTSVRLVELPPPPSSPFGFLGSLLGVKAEDAPERSLIALPVVRALLEGIPRSVLVDPGVPQARLPFDVTWE